MIREQKRVGTVDYLMYFPPAGTPANYVILYFHGLGEVGKGIDAIEVNEIPEQFKNGLVKDCILFAPYLASGASWPKSVITTMLDLIKPYTQKKIVTGLSLGGIATVAAVNFAHERYGIDNFFDGAAVVCGKTGLTNMTPFLNTPFIWWHGTNDTTISINSARTFKTNLTNAGGQIELIELVGMGHNIWGTAYNESNFWTWLKGFGVPVDCQVKEIDGEIFAFAGTKKYKLNATLQ